MSEERYVDCEVCDERYNGDDIANYIREVEVKGEAVSMCISCINGPRARSFVSIVSEIIVSWKKVNYAAVPYLAAMRELTSIDDKVMNDPGRTIVRYFLANAGSFRGPAAKRLKAELKELL